MENLKPAGVGFFYRSNQKRQRLQKPLRPTAIWVSFISPLY
jgi:hypothetical protein